MSAIQLKHYFPSLFAFLAAWFFIEYPPAAVFILAGACIGFGLIYSMIISKIHRSGGLNRQHGEPNFRHVAFQVFQAPGEFRKTPGAPPIKDVQSTASPSCGRKVE